MSFRNLLYQPIIAWLSDAVLESDRTEQSDRAETTKKLWARRDQIDARIEIMYKDKLDGRITVEFFDKLAATLRQEQDGRLREIKIFRKRCRPPLNRPLTWFA